MDNKPPINILYEDNHLLVVVKPVNLLTQKDGTGDIDFLSLLKMDIKIRYEKPGNVFLGLVHRLDRPAGGVMVFARTSKAAGRLSDQIRNHKIQKIYLAVLRGKMNKEESTLLHYLNKDKKRNQVTISPYKKPGTKAASLKYKTLAIKKQLSLVQIQLQTGRPHQIRAQFSYCGCPLYGDQKYGVHVNKPGQQLALWSTRISLIHPTRKERLTFTSFPPAKFPWCLFNIANLVNKQ